MTKEVYFDVMEPNLGTFVLIFNNAKEAKSAFRAILNVTGPADGIFLKIKSKNLILLDKKKEGYLIWTSYLAPLVAEVISEKRYKIFLKDGALGSEMFHAPALSAGTTLC